MKRSAIIVSILSVALMLSIVLHIVQYIRHGNDSRQAEEQFMVQVNRDVKDTYDLIKSFIEEENRSDISLHGIAMKLEGLHSLLSSNNRLTAYSLCPLDFMTLGRFLYGGGWVTGPIFNGTFPGIYHDGVVSNDEIAFLEILSTQLEYFMDNACLEVRVFNEVFAEFNKEWETLPLKLLEG